VIPGLIARRPRSRSEYCATCTGSVGRLAIKPGITGWAQVNGRATLPWPERIELDLYYIEHRSPALDLQILRRTVSMVLGGSDLYKGAAGGWEGEL
jgi:lipopolysaccharide/colanic/teichoic acid biosynthesis glycosyltransferase